MEPILSRRQARQLDARVIDAGVNSTILMENAGRGAADVLRRGFANARVLVVCGAGNNAGDGLVLARRWLVWGGAVRVWLTTTALSQGADTELRAYQACGGLVLGEQRHDWQGALDSADVLVDALFGTGLSRAIGGEHAALIDAMNTSGKPIVALDLPSGLDCDRGVALGACVRAHTTVCFGAAKRATATTLGKALCGHVEVVDIGVPLPIHTLEDALVWAPSRDAVRAKLTSRPPVTHKGQAGQVVVVAGELGTTGAALLAARGAFRAGAGLVTIATHQEVARVLESQSPEVMKVALASGTAGLERLTRLLARATAVVVGPGLGLSPDATAWVEHVVNRFDGPVVVDADAITLCSRGVAWSKNKRLVFTPHPGEAARLLATTTARIEGDRFGALDELVGHTGNVVVLKGAPTLVGAQGTSYVTKMGRACMSTAGAGDVLSGIIAALACQLDVFDAAWVGAWLHASAGELWARSHGDGRGMLAGELADNVPAAMFDAQLRDGLG